MRAVIQRVSHASVTINSQVKGTIQKGLLVLLGIEETDTAADIEWLSGKLVRLRIFDDENGVMNLSVQDVQGDILLVSQFTLYADARKGNRPSYADAAPGELAEPLYERFCERLAAKRGAFGARMAVELVNDGPVTILLEA